MTSTMHTSPPAVTSARHAHGPAWAKHERVKSLVAFVAANKDARFEWGKWDCALFAASGIQAMTGTDIASDFRNGYTDEAGAMATIKAVCGGTSVADAAAYCASKHNLKELAHPLMAQRGDLVIVEDSGRLVAGLVNSNGRHVVAAGQSGLNTRIPIGNVKRAWRI
jgi:hypothetical protein